VFLEHSRLFVYSGGRVLRDPTLGKFWDVEGCTKQMRRAKIGLHNETEPHQVV
jgi:hypothetical protein